MSEAEFVSPLKTVACNDYHADQLAEQAGHAVLPLPSFNCEITLIELLWSQLNGHIAFKNKTFKVAHVKPLVYNASAHVTSAVLARSI